MAIAPPLLLRQLAAFGEAAVATIRQNIRKKDPTGYGPMYTTGKSLRSIRYYIQSREDGLTLVIEGVGYAGVLEAGRAPGKMPPIKDIEAWIKAKFVTYRRPDPKTGKVPSAKGLAFVIARKIADKGTILHQQGGKSGILSEVVNRKAMDDLGRKALAAYSLRVDSFLLAA